MSSKVALAAALAFASMPVPLASPNKADVLIKVKANKRKKKASKISKASRRKKRR